MLQRVIANHLAPGSLYTHILVDMKKWFLTVSYNPQMHKQIFHHHFVLVFIHLIILIFVSLSMHLLKNTQHKYPVIYL